MKHIIKESNMKHTIYSIVIKMNMYNVFINEIIFSLQELRLFFLQTLQNLASLYGNKNTTYRIHIPMQKCYNVTKNKIQPKYVYFTFNLSDFLCGLKCIIIYFFDKKQRIPFATFSRMDIYLEEIKIISTSSPADPVTFILHIFHLNLLNTTNNLLSNNHPVHDVCVLKCCIV